MTTKAKPLHEAIGERLRQIREAHKKTQEDMSREVRAWGLPWSRATIAGLETGARDLSVSELFMLLMALKLPLTELLPVGREEDPWIELIPGGAIPASALRLILQGQSPPVWSTGKQLHGFSWAKFMSGYLAREQAQIEVDIHADEEFARSGVAWPGASMEERRAAYRDSAGETERKAGVRLGIAPFAVALAARKVWKRGVAEERDARIAAADTRPSSPQTLQALRGHVTRELLKELRPLFEKQFQKKPRRAKPRKTGGGIE